MINDLTVFVISCGQNPCFNDCLNALKNQSIKFKIEIIKNVYPMSAAFQLMIDKCTTKYYVQIDEDMIIDYDGIELLYDSAKISKETSALIAFKLLDVHLNFEIYGVKIYKHDILKKYPYDLTSMSCEVEQMNRLKNDGYSTQLMTSVIGKHAPKWTNEAIFERYYNLMDKFKEFKYLWIADLPLKLWNLLKTNPTENNLYALLGIYSSLITEKIQIGEKDFRFHNENYLKMKSFLDKPTSANLYLTSKCNYNCNFCYRNNDTIEHAKDMTITNVGNLLFRFPSIKTFCLAGYGEPFLCDNLFEIIEYLNSKNKVVGLITNGSLIIENSKKLLNVKNKLEYISISLNAPNSKIHNEVNKSNTFEKVIEGIKFCIDNNIETYCSYVCCKSNLKYIPEFLKLIKSLNVKTVHLLNILPHLASNYNDENFWNEVLTDEDKIEIDKLTLLPEFDLIKVFPFLIKKDEIMCNCQMPWNIIGINGNESISLCGSIFAPQKSNGTLQDIENACLNDYAKSFRQSLSGPDKMKDLCKLCFRNYSEYIPEKNIENKKLEVCKIIDQFGWAYYFIAKDQQKYSSHNIEYKRLLDIDVEKINSNVVYIHAPNINYSKNNELITSLKQKNIKVIGGYGGESELKYYPEPDLIVSISIRHLAFLKKMYTNVPVIFLPECVDTDYFKPIEKMYSFIVGWAGCLREVKRPHLLDKLNFKVEKKSEWGTKYFVDGQSLDKMKDFYHSIDVLILTSISECMPRVVLEAMSCGLPVISTRVGCISMLLDDQWIISVLPEETVVDEMNFKLNLLQNNLELRKQVGERNRKHIERFFSWSINQILWDNVFELIVLDKYQEIMKISDNFIKSIPNFNDLVFENLNEQKEQTSFSQHVVEEKIIENKINPIFISYYTKNTGYENEYKKLENSLIKFKLNYEIVAIDSKGSWFDNCFYRTEFIKNMLNKHKRPVIWVDCDAIIQQYPELLFNLKDIDFACHLRLRKNGGTELLGGTMFFNNSKASIDLLDKWKELVNNDGLKRKYKLDQSYLHEAVNSLKQLKTFNLPATYCQIFDLMKNSGNPVIEHFQASRRLK